VPIDVDSLPNPYLATYLPVDFTLSKDARSILTEHPLAYGASYAGLSNWAKRTLHPLRRAHLKAAHLPRDYDELPDEARQLARYAVYESWYDKRKTGDLVADVDNLVAGLYLYVEHLLKADAYTGGMYFMRDPKTKYDVVRQAMSPPKKATEPAKTVMHQSRGTTKTVTIIRQLCPFMCITRPYTEILITEVNGDRTQEEVGKIREDVENNILIHQEFGGYGKLWPRRGPGNRKWNQDELNFVRLPMCRLAGFSLDSAQRGRHPVFGVIDDPEDNDTVKQNGFREWFFEKLFSVYLGMFYPGGKITWMGTVIRGSCLQIALRGSDTRVDAFGDEDRYIDPRFDDWTRIHNRMVRINPLTGERESIMPDHTSVEAYDDRLQSWGAATRAAEMDGDPLAPGQFALLRDEFRHGYMHCQEPGTGNEYFLDLLTGQTLPWKEFLSSLYVATGCDPADSLATTADCGACNVSGADTEGTVYVLDQFIERMVADDWVERSMMMASEWNAVRSGWETAAMQRVVLRMAKRFARELEDQGRPVPLNIPVPNTGAKKHQRVLAALRPLYRKNLIRFPRFSPFTDARGVTHVPALHPNRSHLLELLKQLDTYTDEGASGADDGADSLQICLRAVGNRRGKSEKLKDQNTVRYERLERLGFNLGETVPHELLPASVRRILAEDEEPVATSANVIDRDDPYD
jgi:hypothetical protein